MRNIKLTIRYDGTRYAGWQSQNNAKAIQDVVEAALAKITGANTHLTGSGRTDAGVHALAQIANFKTASKIPLNNLRMALNKALPKDIAIYNAEEAPLKFDAQRSARSKLYRYTIMNNNFVDPFMRNCAAKCFYKLNINKMRKAAKYLEGRHDFKAFQAVDGLDRSSIRTIKHIKIAKKGDLVYIYINAGGFLYNMARSIAGTLVEAGRGKITADKVKEILRNKERRLAGPTMPARGLCLVKVEY